MPATESSRIADQLRRSVHGTAWHGPSVTELLDGIGAAEAQARPIPGGHTIWELVLHVTAWQQVALDALRGAAMPADLPPEKDWPPLQGTTAGHWTGAQQKLLDTTATLADAIADVRDDMLPRRIAGREYSTYFLLHGVVQHTLYHAGQIALLRRAISGQSPDRVS